MGNSSFVKLMENPVNSTLHFACTNLKGDAIAQIISNDGNVKAQAKIFLSNNIQSISVDQLIAGYYYLLIYYQGNIYNVQFVKY